MGPTYPGMPPCWERPGCLHCWLFKDCWHGRFKDGRRCHPENYRRAQMAGRTITKYQLKAALEQERPWTKELRVWPVPSAEEAEMIYGDPHDELDDYQCNKEDDVAHGGDTLKKKPTANLDKAKKRFRTAAWWCFGVAAGLVGGKIYVDLGIYFGMPAKIPAGPMKVWAVSVWTAAVALYVFLYAAIWVAATSIRRKLKINTAYDVTMGDVRVVKVNPEMQQLLTYTPTEEVPQIEATTEAVKATVAEEE